MKKEITPSLLEGGNARYINRETGEVAGFAGKMDLKQIPRTKLVDEVIKVLDSINTLFEKKYDEKLWKNFDVIANGKALNGSSSSLFNKDITDEEFVEHKPLVGDIDITFPNELMGQLWELLNDIEGKKLGDFTTYLGHKNSNMNPDAAKNQGQINAIFEISADGYKTNAQIDFEASEYENHEPTKWASFSHNSTWEDIKAGFKGVAHKYTLLNLARALSKLDGISVITVANAQKVSELTKDEYETGKPVKISTSQEFVNPTDLAFSVAKGIRRKFAPVFFKDGKEQLIIDGRPVFYKEETSKSTYITDLEIQFEMIFQVKPKGSDMKDFESFVGLVKLLKKYGKKMGNSVIEDFFISLTQESLWGVGQKLERDSAAADYDIKDKIISHLFDELPELTSLKNNVDKLIMDYYDFNDKGEIVDYKGNSTLAEKFIPFGSKFSAIFEAVSSTPRLKK
jgi:hypothetical protein